MKKSIIGFLMLIILGTTVQASSDEESDEPELKLRVFAMTLLQVPDDTRAMDEQVAKIIAERQPDVVKLRGSHPRLMRVLELIKNDGYRCEAIQQSSLCMGVITNTSLVLFRDDLDHQNIKIMGAALQLTKHSDNSTRAEKLVVAFDNGTTGSLTFEPIELKHLLQWANTCYPMAIDKGTVIPDVRIFTGLFDLQVHGEGLEENGALHLATKVVSHEYLPLHFSNYWPENRITAGWVHDHVFFTGRNNGTTTYIYPLKDRALPQNCPIITEFSF